MKEGFTFYRKRTVTSTKPVEPGKIYKLSPLDLLMENHHLKMIYYYNTPKGFSLSENIEIIREQLAQVLSYFPVVIGRLVRNEKGKWMIKCNDAGMRLIDARIKGSLKSWLENLDEEKEKMLVDWEDISDVPYFWATFYAQVTEFEEGGLAVGLSCSHMLADSQCATLFMKAWADTMLCGRVSVPPFCHQLPQHRLGFRNTRCQPNNYLIDQYKSILQNPTSSPTVAQNTKTIALKFTHNMVQACMNSAQLNGPNMSPFVPLVGLLWVSISRAKGLKHGLLNMSIYSDMRQVLGLDQGFFGNCMIYNKVHGDGLNSNNLVSATNAIIKAIGNVNREGIIDLIEWLENSDNISMVLPLRNGLVFINLENIDSYSATFMDSYEPIRVSYYNESNIEGDKVLVIPSHPNEGQLSRTIMITLPSHEATKLCEDQLLARYSPVILMGAH